MGLDIHVLPIWRFLSGDFESVLDKLTDGNIVRIGASKPDDEPKKAMARVKKLREAVSQNLGTSISWNEEGPVVETQQFDFNALQAIRAYAAYLEYPLPLDPRTGQPSPFAIVDNEPEEHPSLLLIYRGATTRYPHLIHHADNSGFYLPVEFPEPVSYVETTDEPEDPPPTEESLRLKEDVRVLMANFGSWWNFFKVMFLVHLERFQRRFRKPPLPPPIGAKKKIDWYKVGSSTVLLRELNELNRHLGLTKDWSDLKHGEPFSDMADPLYQVKYGWLFLQHMARLSVEHKTPIVFDG